MGFAKAKAEQLIVPTNAGLLLFGYEPQIFYTQAEVLIMYYGDTMGARRYLDRKILGGTLTEQIDAAENYLRLAIPVAAYTEGFKRVDEPDVSLEALREAVVNAVAHRDYSIGGTAVRIFIYPDRVEVRNPGHLMPGLTLAELQNGGGTSRPRNQLITTTLRDLPGGYMERAGSGIHFMFEQMQALGLETPQIRTQGDEFVVTFNRRGLFKVPSNAESSFIPNSGARIAEVSINPITHQLVDTATMFNSSGLPQEQLTSQAEITPDGTLQLATPALRWEAALKYVQTHGSITNKAYRELTRVGETTAIRDLDALVRQGSLRVMGNGRSRHYRL
jgi:predicted HTH transcriptional regulator